MALVQVKTLGYITKILDHLYLADYEVSQDIDLLKQYDINYIINLSNSEIYTKFDNVEYQDIPIPDDKTIKISDYFEECINIVNKVRDNKQNILVHCMHGVSRSVSIILCYLMNNEYTLRKALIYVKNIRTNQYVQPNIGFFKQLMEYERELQTINSITLAEYTQYKYSYILE
jgi:protein-tyrosine phosphatase